MSAEMNQKNIRHTRMIAIAVLAAVLFVALFSSCYIAKEANHHCSEKSCPICTMLGQCEGNLKQIGSGLCTIIVLSAVIRFVCDAISQPVVTVAFDTLITRKVRLND